MGDDPAVSFTTGSGKEVKFQATPRASRAKKAKTVLETFVIEDEPAAVPEPEPVEPPPPEPVESPPPEPEPVVEPVEPVEEPVALPKAPRAKPRAKAKAKGLPERSPRVPKAEFSPERASAIPPPPVLEREAPALTHEQFNDLMTEYLGQGRRSRRDARLSMYRSWL
jgi:protein TonB